MSDASERDGMPNSTDIAERVINGGEVANDTVAKGVRAGLRAAYRDVLDNAPESHEPQWLKDSINEYRYRCDPSPAADSERDAPRERNGKLEPPDPAGWDYEKWTSGPDAPPLRDWNITAFRAGYTAAVQAERERCAGIAEERRRNWAACGSPGTGSGYRADAAARIAAALRGEDKP